jgi:beta-mannosidase
MRGLNWVPADSFPGRLRPEHYARLLGQARQSGANLLRVWGGGLREKRAFYELCDALGLLVWQEFPFACMFLGAYPRDPAYLALVAAECGAMVKQLVHHPALIIWCGGNEFSRSRNRPLLKTLATVVERYDGTRPFIPVSPSHGHGGDSHNWDVWHGLAPLPSYQAETARFLSEFGLQALPHLDSLKTMLLDLTGDWEIHHADVAKLMRYVTIFPALDTVWPAQPTPRLIYHSQLAQALALQIGSEHMRRRRGQGRPTDSGGLCLWQFNEPWPAISWAIVDYFGRPKLAFERLADWYQPILLSLKFRLGRRWSAGETFRAEIWTINDSLTDLAGARLTIYFDQIPVHYQTVDLPAQQAISHGYFSHRLTAPPRQISLTLSQTDQLVSQNRYDLTWQEQPNHRFYQRFRRWIGHWALR